jgi:hypothetical protein
VQGFTESFIIAICLWFTLKAIWSIMKWVLKRTLCREYFYKAR